MVFVSSRARAYAKTIQIKNKLWLARSCIATLDKSTGRFMIGVIIDLVVVEKVVLVEVVLILGAFGSLIRVLPICLAAMLKMVGPLLHFPGDIITISCTLDAVAVVQSLICLAMGVHCGSSVVFVVFSLMDFEAAAR